jgi:hypothetical protein
MSPSLGQPHFSPFKKNLWLLVQPKLRKTFIFDLVVLNESLALLDLYGASNNKLR